MLGNKLERPMGGYPIKIGIGKGNVFPAKNLI